MSRRSTVRKKVARRTKPTTTLEPSTAVARTIRFPVSLRAKIQNDAERCGRSFESQVIALLRRHFGENVDIAPAPAETLRSLHESVAGISEEDEARFWGRGDRG